MHKALISAVTLRAVKSVEVTNLENGYYDLTAVCKNASEEGVSVFVRSVGRIHCGKYGFTCFG